MTEDSANAMPAQLLADLSALLPALARSCAEIIKEQTGRDITLIVLAHTQQSPIEQLCFSSNHALGNVEHLRELVNRTLLAAQHSPEFQLAHGEVKGHA